MPEIFRGPKIEIVTISGTLRVTIHPRPHWLLAILVIGVDLGFATFLYQRWTVLPVFVRVIWLWAMISSALAMWFQFVGEEIIEIDARKLSIRKGIHGWERKREFEIDDCRELEWRKGREGSPPTLECKIGWRTVKFGGHLSEDQSIEIMAALQQSLPEVAQKLGAFPASKEHFLSLGLNR